MIGRNISLADGNDGNNGLDQALATFRQLALQNKNSEKARSEARDIIVGHAREHADLFNGSQLRYPNGVVVTRTTRVTPSFDESKVSTSWIDAFLETDSSEAISVTFNTKKIKPGDLRAATLLREIDYEEHLKQVYSVTLGNEE